MGPVGPDPKALYSTTVLSYHLTFGACVQWAKKFPDSPLVGVPYADWNWATPFLLLRVFRHLSCTVLAPPSRFILLVTSLFHRRLRLSTPRILSKAHLFNNNRSTSKSGQVKSMQYFIKILYCILNKILH